MKRLNFKQWPRLFLLEYNWVLELFIIAAGLLVSVLMVYVLFLAPPLVSDVPGEDRSRNLRLGTLRVLIEWADERAALLQQAPPGWGQSLFVQPSVTP